MVDKEVAYSPQQAQKQVFQGGGLAPPKYYISYFEWLIMRGILILKNANATQTGALMYTVPKDKFFFLISLSINSENVANTGSFESAIAVDEKAFSISTSTTLIRISATATVTENNANQSMSFPIPLKFIEGFKFYAYDNPSADGNSECCIQGYEISKEFFEIV